MEFSNDKTQVVPENVDSLLETSDELLKNAIDDNKRRRAIKNMVLPIMWSHEELYEKKVIFSGMRQRGLLNAYREVRIRLLQKSKRENFVLLVSSVTAAIDSSAFAFNLAATFALDQHKTALYIDCNPYSSTGEHYSSTPIDQGLMHYLADYTVPIQNIIYPSGIERLRVIPSGGTNESAAEFFNSKRMEILIAEIKTRYPDRFVVIDAPSVQQSTEARILTQFCDHALLVVPFGKVVVDEVLSAVDAVGKDHFAGLVFNN